LLGTGAADATEARSRREAASQWRAETSRFIASPHRKKVPVHHHEFATRS
jgi:hypothetical protein